jgi:ATP-binding cassette subfamily C protein
MRQRKPPARLVLHVLGARLRRRPGAVAGVILWSAVEAAPTLAFGRAVAGATDAFLDRRIATGFAWLALMVLAAAVGAVGSRQVYPHLAAIVEPLRDDLVRDVVDGALRRSTRFGVPPDSGAVSRITHQVEIVRDTFGGLVMAVGTFAFTAGSALIGLMTLAPFAAAFVVPPLAAGLALFFGVLHVSARRQRESILADEAVAEAASTAFGALRDIVACGAEDRIRRQVDAHVEAQARMSRALARLGVTRSLALSIGGWLPLVSVLLLAPWLLRDGVTPGTIVGILAYIRGGLQPALQTLVHGVGSSGMRLAVTLERIIEASDPPGPPAARPTGGAHPLGHDLEARALRFAYGPAAEPVIRDLDLLIPDGDHLAIVGPSGIGKSTLAHLLAGMLRPLEGDITLGGVALASLDPAAVARERVLIPQEAYVFAGTLGDNLSYLDPDSPGKPLDAAVDAVGLRLLVDRLGGYLADVDPAALSAGERQLIALTRAYLSPARIAVLDEATCHLDPAAEARAERAFACRPGTLVVIAHRVSSAMRARRILVLDGTRALAGTHESLLVESPLYRDLVGHWSGAAIPPEGPAGAGLDLVRNRQG